jgi:hypothetical protein
MVVVLNGKAFAIDLRSKDQMVMVGQQLVTDELDLEELQPFEQNLLEGDKVAFLLENVRSQVPTVERMVQPTRFICTYRSWHNRHSSKASLGAYQP